MKFCGQIGFGLQKEVRPGITSTIIEERIAYGDVLSNVRRWETGADVNRTISTSNRISILAERFFYENLGAMLYCRWNGTVWEVKSAEIVRPRIILTLGGVYSGKQADTEEEGEGSPEEGSPEEP